MFYISTFHLFTLSVTFGPFLSSALLLEQKVANTTPTNKSNFIINKKNFKIEWELTG